MLAVLIVVHVTQNWKWLLSMGRRYLKVRKA
jgi:hypothetical protein